MKRKRLPHWQIILAALMFAILAMPLMNLPKVSAWQKTEVVLPVVSGNNVDATEFTYNGHLLSEGFGATISAFFPVGTSEYTQTKMSFAVAGLGDSWMESYLLSTDVYTPYVKEMRMNVSGLYTATIDPEMIFTNTGTGSPSYIEFLKAVLDALGYAFTAYDIYSLLKEVYQTPPLSEWTPGGGHWQQAVVRQKQGAPPWYIVSENRLKTAGASVQSKFDVHGSTTLTIHAEADIWVQCISQNIWGDVTVWHGKHGTYSVTFQVSPCVNLPPNTPDHPESVSPLPSDPPGTGYPGVTYTFYAGATDPEGDDIYYDFDWNDGSPITRIGPFSSGSRRSATHSWGNVGTYYIRVRAVDTFSYEGDWSVYYDLSITAPRLTIATSFGGNTNPTPGTYTYAYGDTATVTAIPDSGCIFDHWILDGATVGGNPKDVPMTADHNIQAYFAEQNLTTVLNTLGFTNTRLSTLDRFIPGTYSATLYAELGGWHSSCELSWYNAGSSLYSLIFSGPEGNFGYTNPPIVKSFTASNKFGLSIYTPEGGRFYTETSRNPDGVQHAMVYQNLVNPDMYLIGFEHGYGGADLDYNDMVIALELTSPSVVNINGTNWYYRNTTSTRALVVLNGGFAAYSYVIVKSWDYGETSQKALFINDLVQNGVDVLANKDDLTYDGSQTFVRNASQWLWDRGYTSVYVFGYSGGGVVIAYEIQKDYASTQFSGAILVSAPVDWDGMGSPIYQSAHTAANDKVATCFIEGVSDTYRAQMLNYYGNATIHKLWHNWNSGHDIFGGTCQDHTGENAQTAVINWFNAAHPPNTPLAPSGPRNSDLYLPFSYYTTSTVDPNWDNVVYVFDWGDGTNSTTGSYSSRATAQSYHYWTHTGNYTVKVQAKDSSNTCSLWSSSITVNVTLNDDGTYTDAANSFACATTYNPYYQTGTLLLSNPVDCEDWYQFYADTNKTISAWLSSTLGCNFDLELYYPNGTRRAFSNSTSSYDTIYITATVSGYWRMRLYRVSGEGLYYFGVSVYTPGGGGGCPTLFVWNGSTYVDYGVINIHDESGQDLIRTVPINAVDVSTDKPMADFRLREGWSGLTFSESFIDQVKLFAIDDSGNWHRCPLVSAWHSELGNVLHQLLLSDDKRVQSLLMETIDLEFLVPHQDVSGFVFVIEGFNPYKR